MLTGCATGQADDPMLFPQSAYSSRAAAVIGYDEPYVKTLSGMIDSLRAEGNRSPTHTLNLLFALDELTDIYTYRLVDFEKAARMNAEIENLLSTIPCCPNHLRALFVPRHRQMYRFLWLDREKEGGTVIRELSASQVKLSLNPLYTSGPSGMERNDRDLYLKTAFTPKFLQKVAEEDLAGVTRRVKERKRLLERVMEHSAIPAPPQQDPKAKMFGLWEVEVWRRLIDVEAPSAYARDLLMLERAWKLADLQDESWLRAVLDFANEALRNEATAANAPEADRIRLRFRAGLASLRLNRLTEGLQRFDEMQQVITEYDRAQKSLYEQAEAGARKETVSTVLAVGIINAFRNFETQTRQLQESYGRGGHGLRGFLNEHERLAFHYELGYGYERVGRRRDAIAQYKAAIEILERQRATLGTEEKRIRFIKDKDAPYKRLIPLLIEEGDLDGAFHYMERARSRAFVDLLATGRIRLGAAGETQRYETMIRKQSEIQLLVDDGSLPREIAEETHQRMRGVKTVKDEARMATTAEFDSLSDVATAALPEIQRVVGKEAALLAFFISDEKTSVILLQDGRLQAWVKPLSRDIIANRIQAYRSLLETPGKAASVRAIQQQGRTLYVDLIEEAIGQLTKRVVYVLPHGPLHYLPFATLHDGAGYVIDRLTLLTVPSATVLTYLDMKQRTLQGSPLIFANPDLGDTRLDLPFAQEEGVAVQSHLPGAVLLMRKDATESYARRVAAQANVLHFAAHATFKQEHPLDSAVMLAPGEGEDGALTVAEIFSLKLPGSLVVLSGCETGMGTVAAGDELIGLTRAFMYAGAPQLLATLWQVDDQATASLMTEFYKQLTTRPAADALRLAQISVRASHPHPFYWAAFTTYGQHR
jgi:CHAT domain-containing protein